MSTHVQVGSTHKCPQCSFPLGRRTTTCEYCGTFVPLEHVSGSSNLFKLLLGRRLSEIPPHEIAYLLSWIPLLIGPPMAALAIAMMRILQDRNRLGLPEWQRPIAIALVNIVLSLVVWKYVGHHLSDALGDWLYWLKSLGPGQHGNSHLIPARYDF